MLQLTGEYVYGYCRGMQSDQECWGCPRHDGHTNILYPSFGLEQGKGTGTRRVAHTVPILSMIINIMMEAVVEL